MSPQPKPLRSRSVTDRIHAIAEKTGAEADITIFDVDDDNSRNGVQTQVEREILGVSVASASLSFPTLPRAKGNRYILDSSIVGGSRYE